MMVMADGKMMRVNASDKSHAMMMKDAKVVDSGVILYRSGGKLYMVENKKNSDGTMWHEGITN